MHPHKYKHKTYIHKNTCQYYIMQQSDYSKAGGLIHQENKHVSFTLTWLKTLKYVYTVWQHTSVWVGITTRKPWSMKINPETIIQGGRVRQPRISHIPEPGSSLPSMAQSSYTLPLYMLNSPYKAHHHDLVHLSVFHPCSEAAFCISSLPQ